MSRGKFLIFFVLASALFWWIFLRTPKGAVNSKVSTEQVENLGDFEASTNDKSKEPFATPKLSYLSNEGQVSAEQTQSLVGIEREIRECLQDADWASKLSSDYGTLEVLAADIMRELKPIEVDTVVYKENTIKLADGSLRVVRFEIGTNIDGENNNNLYWAKLDEEGFPIPVDIPSDVKGTDEVSFQSLLKKGEIVKRSETRLLRFVNEVEMSMVNTDGKVTSLSVQTIEHQIYCTLDAAKAYSCDCPY